MRIINTDGKNEDFIALCARLDEHLNYIMGGEKQRAVYAPFNTLGEIHDAFVAYEDDKPAGCAAFKRYSEGVAEVKRVFVRPEYRGKGIARFLMTELTATAKRQGYNALILETGRPLEAAIRLYESIGFEVIENYGQYKSLPDSVCMKKEI